GGGRGCRKIGVGGETEEQRQAVAIDLRHERPRSAVRRRLGERCNDVGVFGREERPRGELRGDARRDPLEAGAVRRVLVGGDASPDVDVLDVLDVLGMAEETGVAELGARLAHDRLDEVLHDVDGCAARNESRSLGVRQLLLQPPKELRPDARLHGALPREQPAELVSELRRDADVRVLQRPQRGMRETGRVGPRIARASGPGVPRDFGLPDRRRNQTDIDHVGDHASVARSACQSTMAAWSWRTPSSWLSWSRKYFGRRRSSSARSAIAGALASPARTQSYTRCTSITHMNLTMRRFETRDRPWVRASSTSWVTMPSVSGSGSNNPVAPRIVSRIACSSSSRPGAE